MKANGDQRLKLPKDVKAPLKHHRSVPTYALYSKSYGEFFWWTDCYKMLQLHNYISTPISFFKYKYLNGGCHKILTDWFKHKIKIEEQ